MTKRKMFLRMVTASLLRRRSRMLIALLSIAIGATILSGLVTIYYDVPRQMGAQFRSYGANMILLPAEDSMLTRDSMDKALEQIPAEYLVGATPYRYVRLDMTSRQQSFTTAGTIFEQVQKTSPYFSVEGEYPEGSKEILVGKEIADTIGVKAGIPFTEEEKQKLMEYLQQKWSQTYFLIYLSKQRTNGRFSRSEKLVKDLSEILNLILQTAESQNDYEAARNCMILSQTYYFEDKDENGNAKKVYLLEYILEYKWLRTPQFWRGLIEEMTGQEIKKYSNMNPGEPSLFDETNEKSRERLSNIAFSQLLPYCNNMKEFFMDDRIVVKIIDEFVEKYHIQKEWANSIYDVINSNPEELEKLRQEYKNNPNIENELMSLEEVKKQRGVS